MMQTKGIQIEKEREQIRDIIILNTSNKYTWVDYMGFKDIENNYQIVKIVDTLGNDEYYFYIRGDNKVRIDIYNQGTLQERSKYLTLVELIEHRKILLDYDYWYLMYN